MTEPVATPPPRRTLAVWIASGLGFGFSPVAPGTMGALWGLPLAWAVGLLSWQVALLVIVILCVLGIPLSTRAARDLGGKKDPGIIVWDEIASMPITFFLVPMASIEVVLIGFLLNRIFDISKFPPANYLEHLPDGLGIMSDDWAAGIWSCLALHLILWLGWLPFTA